MREKLKVNNYITTYTRKKFYPLNPDKNDIEIEDIAHSLSLLARANGHMNYFFSVAQHSINCAIEAKARGYGKALQLACLLHDGSEAYLGDITRPLKQHLDFYLEIEEKVQGLVWEKFLSDELTDDDKKKIYEIDDDMLYYEFGSLRGILLRNEPPLIFSKPDLKKRAAKHTEKKFLNIFNSLSGI
jgi:hypothetical protein